MDVTNEATWEDAHAPDPEPDYPLWEWCFDDYGQDIIEGSPVITRTGRHSLKKITMLWWRDGGKRPTRQGLTHLWTA